MTQPASTILIIDNDEGLLAAIATRLGSMGYHCITAVSGAQGLACFKSQPVDLIISDLNMPAGDGVTLAQSIRETSEVPIIIITGFRDEYRRSLRSISNITLMEKPFDSDQLLDLVEAELVMSGSKLPV